MDKQNSVILVVSFPVSPKNNMSSFKPFPTILYIAELTFDYFIIVLEEFEKSNFVSLSICIVKKNSACFSVQA